MNKLKSMTPVQACIIGLVIAAVYYFSAYEGTDKIKRSMIPLHKKKADLKLELEKMDRVINEAIAYQQTINALGATINKVIKYIPETMSSSIMMRRLTEAATISGVNIINVTDKQSMRPNKSEDSSLYAKVPVKISLEGNFTQIMVFLANLTKLDTIFTIDELMIKSDRKFKGSVDFSATFIGYRYKGQSGNEDESI